MANQKRIAEELRGISGSFRQQSKVDGLMHGDMYVARGIVLHNSTAGTTILAHIENPEGSGRVAVCRGLSFIAASGAPTGDELVLLNYYFGASSPHALSDLIPTQQPSTKPAVVRQRAVTAAANATGGTLFRQDAHRLNETFESNIDGLIALRPGGSLTLTTQLTSGAAFIICALTIEEVDE